MKKKQIVTIIVGIIILAVIGVLIYFLGVKTGTIKPSAATYPVTMSLSPATSSVKVGSNFTVDIKVDNAGASTIIASAIIQYDPTYLTVVDQNTGTTGTQIVPGTAYPNVITNQVETVNATQNLLKYEASVQLSDTTNPTPVTGLVTLGTITFNAKAANAAAADTVLFSAGSTDMGYSGVADTTYTNLLTGVTNGSYNLYNATALTLNMTLQGKTSSTANAVPLTVYQAGTTTVIYTNNSVNFDSTGKATIIASGLAAGTYDFKIHVPYFLSTKKNKRCRC